MQVCQSLSERSFLCPLDSSHRSSSRTTRQRIFTISSPGTTPSDASGASSELAAGPCAASLTLGPRDHPARSARRQIAPRFSLSHLDPSCVYSDGVGTNAVWAVRALAPPCPPARAKPKPKPKAPKTEGAAGTPSLCGARLRVMIVWPSGCAEPSPECIAAPLSVAGCRLGRRRHRWRSCGCRPRGRRG